MSAARSCRSPSSSFSPASCSRSRSPSDSADASGRRRCSSAGGRARANASPDGATRSSSNVPRSPSTAPPPGDAVMTAPRFRHPMPFGAELSASGATRFGLWAPSSSKVQLLLARASVPAPAQLTAWNSPTLERHPLEARAGGWHELPLEGVAPGSRYAFEVTARDGMRLRVPDPASRCNPDGVHGASLVLDPLAHRWQHPHWRGRAWEEAVIYEAHVGTCTPQGTFAALQSRLP